MQTDSHLPAPPAAALRASAPILLAAAAVLLAIHFISGNGYGFHRDELQFLDDARHLAAGFVAYPPLTSLLARIFIAIFGISPATLRLASTALNFASLALIVLTARELGGRRLAQALAALCALPIAIALSTLLEYVSTDFFAWALLAFAIARLLRSANPRWWILAGTAAALGILSKYSIAIPVFSLAAAFLALPAQRHFLRTRWFWLGILTMLLIASPNLVWLARHHFITLAMEQHIHARDVRLGRAHGYLADQLKYTLFALPLALAGLVSLLRSPRFRPLAALYVGPFILFALLKGRGYYLLPAYVPLYAAGCVAFEHWLTTRWLNTNSLNTSSLEASSLYTNSLNASSLDTSSRHTSQPGTRATAIPRLALTCVASLLLLANAALICILFLPVYAPGSRIWSFQMRTSSDLRDEVGWPELVRQVAAVRDTLTPEERSRLAIVANNYGEAGALALYGPQYNLPTPISPVNSFHDRGFGPYDPETVIILDDDLDSVSPLFNDCRIAAQIQIPHNVPNEEASHPDIILCHHLKQPWQTFWPHNQKFG